MEASFRQRFVELFDAHFPRVFRFLDRQCGDAELAADLAQDAFVRLYRRGSLPDAPEAWLIAVAANLFRNARAKHGRRARLLTPARGELALADPLPAPDAAAAAGDERARVRAALDRLAPRERQLLLLRVEGYSYRDIAAASGVSEASVGTLLARAKSAFRAAYAEEVHAP
jgi:RNA polymerase sigma-70 factor (ECF subfamily)